MKAPFVFRPRPSVLFSFLAAMFAAKNMPRDIDPDDREHEGSPNKSGGSQPHKHRISKKERKRREHIRRMNPNRKH